MFRRVIKTHSFLGYQVYGEHLIHLICKVRYSTRGVEYGGLGRVLVRRFLGLGFGCLRFDL